MKKIILILLIFVSSVLSAETVYVISRKDYYDLENIKNKLEAKEKSTFSSDIDWDIVKKVLREYDNLRYYSGANSRLDRELTTDEKLSILGGRIDLLEMRLLKMEGLIK